MTLSSRVWLISISLFVAVFVALFVYSNKTVKTKSVPQKILDSIVKVETATGVVVSSNSEYSLVLTAYHVIAKKVEKGEPITVGIAIYEREYDGWNVGWNNLEVIDKFYYLSKDLAILKVKTGGKILEHTHIAKTFPGIGDDVFIAGNPNQNLQTILKSTVSSTQRYVRGTFVWQLSGGTFPGVSGGGAFTMNGELFAVARAVDMYRTGFCAGDYNKEEEWTTYCLSLPLPYVGYFISPEEVFVFLSLSPYFDSDFGYLKEQE